MDHYTTVSYRASKLITNAFSTSFGLSIRLFEASLRPHIYAIYGMVRIADEIVDTHKGADQAELLDSFESEVTHALTSGYSTNPIIQAFAHTARQYSIGTDLTKPFFVSMRLDLTPKKFDQKLYESYIHGSAEVVGLMCLKIFTTSEQKYDTLELGAKKLGAAYQKVNFLRDIASDADELGRWYFPLSSKETFDETAKALIINDIEKDFAAAKTAIDRLPPSSQKAVRLSYRYYSLLLQKLKETSAEDLLKKRVRINNPQKLILLASASLKGNSHD